MEEGSAGIRCHDRAGCGWAGGGPEHRAAGNPGGAADGTAEPVRGSGPDTGTGSLRQSGDDPAALSAAGRGECRQSQSEATGKLR